MMLNVGCVLIIGRLNKKHLYLCLTKIMKKNKNVVMNNFF